MKLSEIYSKSKLVISFEVFPPKDDTDGAKLRKLLYHLDLLKKYSPAFISLTYGAGGTTQSDSFEIIKQIQDLNLNVMPHFTCVGTSKLNVQTYLEKIKSLGIENILALRGDIPNGMVQENFDFKYANELVKFVKEKSDLSIGIAGYPEGHIETCDLKVDFQNLVNKVNCGADAIFTQMFFNNEKYYKLRDNLNNCGIKVPLIPGLLVIRNFAQLDKMLSMARVTVPSDLMTKLEKFKDSPDDVKKIGIEFATNQCNDLIKNGVYGLHFFTLNTSSSIRQILDNLDI